MIGGTVLEIVWIVLAAIGLMAWGMNVRSSLITYRLIRELVNKIPSPTPGDGRVIYARFALTETILFVLIDVLFVLLGIVALSQRVTIGGSLTITIMSLVCSGVITFLGFRWGQVDTAVIKSATMTRKGTRQLPPEEPPL